MKKFLKKLPVMITLLALAVVFGGFYIYMLVRPVSYGMAYKYSKKTDENNYYTSTITVKSNKKAKVAITGKSLGEDFKETVGYWISVKGNKAVLVDLYEASLNGEAMPEEYAMTEEQYNEAVKLLTDDDYNSEGAVTFGTFKVTVDGDTYTCAGAIVFAAVGGVIELCLLTFACLAVVFFLQDKKKTA